MLSQKLSAGPAPTTSRGRFIVLEGGDGAGKSTQVRELTTWLESRGHEVLTTREPGGTDLGLAIRQVLLHGDHVAPRAEALLFAADRAHHVATVIRPALERGAVVVADRYLDSSVAYQGAGRDLAGEDIRALSLWATEGLLPDLTVLLDVDPTTGRARRKGTDDRLEAEADAFHQRVRTGFLDLAAAEPQRYLVLDAALDPMALAVSIRERVAALPGLSALVGERT